MKETTKEYTLRADVCPYLVVSDELKLDLMRMSQQGLARLGAALRALHQQHIKDKKLTLNNTTEEKS